MGELHFIRPYLLWALVPVALIWWGLWRRPDRMTAWRKAIDPHLLEHLLVGETRRSRVLPIHLVLALWLLSVIAMAGPTWEREPSPFADDTAGLIVLLKANSTMDATDVQPSRLERSRQKLQDLLDLRDGAATGLIVYSGSAHLVMPLTRDGRVISTMVSELSSDLMPVDGDALGEALELAAAVLDRAGAAGSVLVVADAVSPSQVEAAGEAAPELPVQFLSIRPVRTTVDDGLRRAAAARGAAVTPLAVDRSDVEGVAARARSEFRPATSEEGGERWRDAGYFMLPLIAILALGWSRKGWVIP